MCRLQTINKPQFSERQGFVDNLKRNPKTGMRFLLCLDRR